MGKIVNLNTNKGAKKIAVDLYHLPQYNFFKNTILSLKPDEVDIFCVNRGKLVDVIRAELPGYNVHPIGDYKKNNGMASMIFRIILPRIFQLYRKIKPELYRFVITAHYQANLVAKMRGIPNIALIDDPRRFVFPLLKYAADEVYLPPFKKRDKNVHYFNALKEWSYLSPAYFRPDTEALRAYGLSPNSYLFIREVSTQTSNYLSQEQGAILSVSENFPKGLPVVLSLENKPDATRYPKEWIILKEPVKHIHSLMYFSQIVISSGDSVAREGAMLGVPSLYAGIRDMPANQILIDRGMLFKIPPEQLVDAIQGIRQGELAFHEQQSFRDRLEREWDNVTELVLSKIKEN